MHIYPVALAGTCLLTSVQAVDFTSVAVNPILAAVSHIPGAPFLLEAVAQTRTSTVTQTATASQTSSSTSSASRQSQPASKQKTYTPVTATLADGTSPKSGSFNSTLRWQSSGVLQHGVLRSSACISLEAHFPFHGSDRRLSDRRRNRRLLLDVPCLGRDA